MTNNHRLFAFTMTDFILTFLALAVSMTAAPDKGYSKDFLYEDEQIVSGYLSGYNEGVMQVSIDYYDNLNYITWCGFECRQQEELDGYIVVAHCKRIGSIATLQFDDRDYKVLVVDCIAQQHIVAGNIFDTGYIAELNFELFNRVNARYGTITYH